jgi:predicted MPP superfamily phosphohydrolase
MEKLMSLLYKFTGGVYIPPELKNIKEKIILHVSDTPACFFAPLNLILKSLKPHYIIHTGDLVDNLKLEFSQSLLPRYQRDLRCLINMLEASSAEHIFICTGNHDKAEIIKSFSRRSTIIENSANIDIEGLNFRISHYASEILTDPQEYNLYGHDLSLLSCELDNRIYLNGITSINVISIEGRQLYKLLYPFGTDDMRLKRGKIGL